MKSYRNLLSIALCVCFAAPAWAAGEIKEVLIRKKSPNVNIRVVIDNPGQTTQQGPLTITLYVRENAQASWEKIKTWNDISRVKAGNEVARDFFDENSARLTKLAQTPGFQARAVLDGPGVHAVERTAVFGNN